MDDSYFDHLIVSTTQMSDFHLGCRIFTTRMSDFHNSDVGFSQLGCRILTTQISDFHKSDVGFSKTSMSDFQQLRWHLYISFRRKGLSMPIKEELTTYDFACLSYRENLSSHDTKHNLAKVAVIC